MELFSTLLVGVCSWFPTARTCSSFSEVYHKVVAERFRVENHWFPSCITHHLQQSHTLAWLLPLFLCYLLHSLLKNTYLFIYLIGRLTEREGDTVSEIFHLLLLYKCNRYKCNSQCWSQVEARSQEFYPGPPSEWQEPNYLAHHLLPAWAL